MTALKEKLACTRLIVKALNYTQKWKKGEAKIRKLEEIFSLLFSNISIVILTWDTSTRVESLCPNPTLPNE